MRLPVVAALCAFIAIGTVEAQNETAEVRLIWADGEKAGRVETRQIEMTASAGGALRFTLPKNEIPSDVSRVEVVPGFMRAKKGEEGYWIDGRVRRLWLGARVKARAAG